MGVIQVERNWSLVFLPFPMKAETEMPGRRMASWRHHNSTTDSDRVAAQRRIDQLLYEA
jgi:hypothetical protein